MRNQTANVIGAVGIGLVFSRLFQRLEYDHLQPCCLEPGRLQRGSLTGDHAG